MVSFWEAFSGKSFVCCALIVLYSIYSTVGLSIASVSNLGGILTIICHLGSDIGYKPPYRTIYIT